MYYKKMIFKKIKSVCHTDWTWLQILFNSYDMGEPDRNYHWFRKTEGKPKKAQIYLYG